MTRSPVALRSSAFLPAPCRRPLQRLVVLATIAAAAALGSFAARPMAAQDRVGGLVVRAIAAAERDEFAAAEQDLNLALAIDPLRHSVRYWRGRVRFCQGKIELSVVDFDRYWTEFPELRSRQWERGIALYYAGRFDDGAAQFADYQTYHDADVENAAWRYLCEAQRDGVDRASRALMPVGPDRRIPMMRLHELYGGRCTPEEVLAEVAKLAEGSPERRSAEFYAHLYLGLWYESREEQETALEHLKRAAEEFPIRHYMGRVAEVHYRRAAQRAAAGSDAPDR